MGVKKLDKKEKRTITYMISLITQVGISMIVPIFLCMFIGIKVNKYIDAPIIVLVSVLFGCVVSFRNVYVLVRSIYAKDMEKENKELAYYKELEEARLAKQKQEVFKKQKD